MKVKILEALKTKYSNLGFSQQMLDGVGTQLSAFVTDKSNIATAVEGAETVLKSFQSFADSRVNTYMINDGTKEIVKQYKKQN